MNHHTSRHPARLAAFAALFCVASPVLAERISGPLVLVDERNAAQTVVYGFRTDGGSDLLPVLDAMAGGKAAWAKADLTRLLGEPALQRVEAPGEGSSGTVTDGTGYCLERVGLQVKWTTCEQRPGQTWTMLAGGYLLSASGLPASLGFDPASSGQQGASAFHSAIMHLDMSLMTRTAP
ncbi:hypothetical protein FHW69_001895 [Luteibacter sp. Sphag1AF]|uniref:hypothetical protein n=1 Tax=Luteibacter sp. Sphag1AF TaxID=2587031 RepID=UPI00161A3868|nr:hypothetical protein [Luteibacter sp. Sphag1AF]MBB3227294.1 hypothetical protein [Luteibacter sp. Sphag1AF]